MANQIILMLYIALIILCFLCFRKYLEMKANNREGFDVEFFSYSVEYQGQKLDNGRFFLKKGEANIFGFGNPDKGWEHDTYLGNVIRAINKMPFADQDILQKKMEDQYGNWFQISRSNSGEIWVEPAYMDGFESGLKIVYYENDSGELMELEQNNTAFSSIAVITERGTKEKIRLSTSLDTNERITITIFHDI